MSNLRLGIAPILVLTWEYIVPFMSVGVVTMMKCPYQVVERSAEWNFMITFAIDIKNIKMSISFTFVIIVLGIYSSNILPNKEKHMQKMFLVHYL